MLPSPEKLVPENRSAARWRRLAFWTALALIPLLAFSSNLRGEKIAAPSAEVDVEAQDPESRPLPKLENTLETAHFILRWTNSSRYPTDNIAEAGIVEETGDYLETAWEKYTGVFGKAPYVPRGKRKIEVLFHDINGFGIACPPDGPIHFDAENWVKRPGIRKPTSAHELFHKLQYAFGYRTKWKPRAPFEWFTEGTATWAEVFVWQQVSATYKLKGLFDEPDRNLYESDYCSLPFWIYFQNRYQKGSDHNPVADFLKAYEARGDEREILADMIGDDPGDVADLFAQFACDLSSDSWRSDRSEHKPYDAVAGPSGKSITPHLSVTDVVIRSGREYSKPGKVSKLGSDYYRFRFPPGTDGRVLTLSVTEPKGGDLSFHLVWEKNGKWQGAPLAAPGNGGHELMERIDRQAADSLMLIISGREKSGAYRIRASLS